MNRFEQPRKKRVLFVCVGNACRSQMAEGFARAYGSDVIVPASAGLSPAFVVAPDTLKAMLVKNVDLHDHFPKHLQHMARLQFDLVVNMSGHLLPELPGTHIIEWEVPDPISMSYDEHCEVRDEIERLVMKLVIDIRQEQLPKFRGQGSGHVELPGEKS